MYKINSRFEEGIMKRRTGMKLKLQVNKRRDANLSEKRRSTDSSLALTPSSLPVNSSFLPTPVP